MKECTLYPISNLSIYNTFIVLNSVQCLANTCCCTLDVLEALVVRICSDILDPNSYSAQRRNQSANP